MTEPRAARRRRLSAAILAVCAVLLPLGAAPASASAPASAPATSGGAALPALPTSVTRTNRVVIRWANPATPATPGPRALSATRVAQIGRTAAAPANVAAVGRAAARPATTGFVRVTDDGGAIYSLGAPLGAGAQATLDRLAALPGVASVEPDYWVTPAADPGPYPATWPTDPFAVKQWDMQSAADGQPFGIDAIGAWAASPSEGAGVTVAVIDTGILPNQKDLVGRWAGGWDMIVDPQTANDGNGRDSNPADPGDACGPGEPSSWHGSHVAGTIVATPDNDTGVFGAAPRATVEPIRVLGTCGGYMTDVIAGVRWAVGEKVGGVVDAKGVPVVNTPPAQVLNLSIESDVPCPDSLRAAIALATDATHNAVVVVAAGNFGANAAVSAPANCPGVIAVSATDQAGFLASFSNFGPLVDLGAPGVGIWSTVNGGRTKPVGDKYLPYDGTSMAAPHVSAAAALVIAAALALPNPVRLTSAEVESVLRATATASPCGTAGCGSGIVNAGKAVAAVVGETTSPVGQPVTLAGLDAANPVTPDPVVGLVLAASDPETGVAEVEVSNDGAPGHWRTFPNATGLAWDVTDPATGGDPAPGSHLIHVRWRNGAGMTSDEQVVAVTYTAGPVATLTTLPVFEPRLDMAVTWSAALRAGATITSYDVRYRVATPKVGFGAYVDWQPGVTATAATLTGGIPGATYCFSSQATDDQATPVTSSWSAERCTALPLDDRALAATGTWTRGVSAASYGGTYRRSLAKGARLTISGVTAKRIGIVVGTGRTGGTLKVIWNGRVLGTYSLRASKAGWKTIQVPPFPSARSGSLRLEVATSGRPVVVDAVYLSRT